MPEERLVIEAEWTVVPHDGGIRAETGLSVVVQGDRIVGVTRERVEDAAMRLRRPGAIAIPGLINLHNHSINGPLFRGLIDDVDATRWGQTKIYSILLPLARLAMDLPAEELEAIVELGLLEVAASGATTVVEMFRPEQSMTFDVAARLGLRFYGAPYLFSAPAYAEGDTRGSSAAAATPQRMVEDILRFRRDYEGAAGDRLRFVFGPHAVDTCDAALLAQIRRAADETGSLVTLHAAQSAGERRIMQERHGTDALDHLDRAGLLRPGTILAHCVYLDEEEIRRVAASGAAIASCPTVFARGGTFAPYWRFKKRGVRVGIATDAYRMDFITEMRNAGLVSKLEEKEGNAASAEDLLTTATIGAAEILQRSDLGVLRAGAQADMVIVDLSRASLQPIFDPVKTLVWYTSAQDIDSVLVAGEFVVSERRVVNCNQAAVVGRARAAVEKVWQRARERGII